MLKFHVCEHYLILDTDKWCILMFEAKIFKAVHTSCEVFDLQKKFNQYRFVVTYKEEYVGNAYSIKTNGYST
jgi:hypothetical protein